MAAAHRYTVMPSIDDRLRRLGVDLGAVLERAGLPPDLLARGPARLPQADYFRLWQAIDDETADGKLAIAAGEALTSGSFDPVVFAAMVSPDLNAAAERAATYQRLVGPMELLVDVAPSHTTLSCRWPGGGPPRLLGLAELLFWVALARAATGHRIEPIRVTVPEPPSPPEAYCNHLGRRIERAEAHAVVFAARDASRAFLTDDEDLWRSFGPDLRTRLHQLGARAAYADRVRAVLVVQLPAGGGTLDAVARELSVSARTLHRRLAEEATTFKEVLHTTRESLARHYLANGSLLSSQIAFLLGYDESSSFYRAFHNWTGLTPERVRAGVG